MRRIALAAVVAFALATPVAASAAQKTGCSADDSGWYLASIVDAATDFYPHLVSGTFASAEEFAAWFDAGVDKNGDDLACVRLSWGYDLNPNSHYYQLGFDLGLGEPLHVITMLDNNRNGD